MVGSIPLVAIYVIPRHRQASVIKQLGQSLQSSNLQTQVISCCRSLEPYHKKTCLMAYANNKGADQPAHPHFADVKKSCRNFSSLSQDDQLIWLMTNESDNIIVSFSKYAFDFFNLRGTCI